MASILLGRSNRGYVGPSKQKFLYSSNFLQFLSFAQILPRFSPDFPQVFHRFHLFYPQVERSFPQVLRAHRISVNCGRTRQLREPAGKKGSVVKECNGDQGQRLLSFKSYFRSQSFATAGSVDKFA